MIYQFTLLICSGLFENLGKKETVVVGWYLNVVVVPHSFTHQVIIVSEGEKFDQQSRERFSGH